MLPPGAAAPEPLSRYTRLFPVEPAAILAVTAGGRKDLPILAWVDNLAKFGQRFGIPSLFCETFLRIFVASVAALSAIGAAVVLAS